MYKNSTGSLIDHIGPYFDFPDQKSTWILGLIPLGLCSLHKYLAASGVETRNARFACSNLVRLPFRIKLSLESKCRYMYVCDLVNLLHCHQSVFVFSNKRFETKFASMLSSIIPITCTVACIPVKRLHLLLAFFKM